MFIIDYPDRLHQELSPSAQTQAQQMVERFREHRLYEMEYCYNCERLFLRTLIYTTGGVCTCKPDAKYRFNASLKELEDVFIKKAFNNFIGGFSMSITSEDFTSKIVQLNL